jgi:hypothetical protein
MIYPDKDRDTIKLTEKGKDHARMIAEIWSIKYEGQAPVKGWVNGVAMPHSAEMGENYGR